LYYENTIEEHHTKTTAENSNSMIYHLTQIL